MQENGYNYHPSEPGLAFNLHFQEIGRTATGLLEENQVHHSKEREILVEK